MSDMQTPWAEDDGRPVRRYIVKGPTRPGNASEVLMDTGIPTIGSKWKYGNAELPLFCCELRVRPVRSDGSFWEVAAVFEPVEDTR